MKKWFIIAAVAALIGTLGLAACGGDDEPSEDPEAALVAYAETRNAKDVDAMLAVFSEDAVIIGHPFADHH